MWPTWPQSIPWDAIQDWKLTLITPPHNHLKEMFILTTLFHQTTALGLAIGLLASVSVAQCYPPGPRKQNPPPAGAGGSGGGSGQPSSPGPLVGTPPQPSSPSSPGVPSSGAPSAPSSPSTGGPRPSGPVTPRSPVGGRGGPSSPVGTPLAFDRGESSLERLKIEWDFPVPRLGAQAMSWKQALRTVRGDDKRPMIILRECGYCKNSDVAFLTRKLNNEKTSLMTRWFHCIKLPANVAEKSHPFHSLFPGRRMPHLVIVDHDGAVPLTYDGQQSQSELWSGMFEVIQKSYKGNAKRAITRVAKYLDHYDKLDAEEKNLLVRYDLALENKGRKHKRTKKIESQLEALRKKIAGVEKKEDKSSDLGLIKAKSSTESTKSTESTESTAKAKPAKVE